MLIFISKKYNIRDYRGGGRSSARETISRVVAGSIADIILRNIMLKSILMYLKFMIFLWI